MCRDEYSFVASLACGVDTVFGSTLSRFRISRWCGFSLPRLLSWHSHAWPHSFCCLLHFGFCFCPEPFVFFHCGVWVSIDLPAITINKSENTAPGFPSIQRTEINHQLWLQAKTLLALRCDVLSSI